MNKNKYLFLDCDGVINGGYWYKAIKSDFADDECRFDFNPICMHILKDITDTVPNLEIIISSSWRNIPKAMERLKTQFIKYEIPLWKDMTIGSDKSFDLNLRERQDQILHYMKNNDIKKNQVFIIDDMAPAYFTKFKGRFIHTEIHDGLTYRDYLKICYMFKCEPIINVM